MYKSIKNIAAGAGFAAVLAAGLSVAAHSSDYSTSTFTSSSGAGKTITMGPETDDAGDPIVQAGGEGRGSLRLLRHRKLLSFL